MATAAEAIKMEENFARVETKFLMDASQTAALEAGLQRQGCRLMRFGSPKVQSLYYDTESYGLICASLDRPAYKEKLRLRAYGEPGGLTQSFVEIKKKYRGVVYKRRTALPLETAMEGLDRRRLPEETGQVGREALWMVRRYGLAPAAVVSYDRNAWFDPADPGFRVTIDRNLAFRNWSLDLNAREDGLAILPAHRRLMEVKTGGAYPLWFARLLRECGAQHVHFSKYGLAYQLYIQPEKQEMKGLRRIV